MNVENLGLFVETFDLIEIFDVFVKDNNIGELNRILSGSEEFNIFTVTVHDGNNEETHYYTSYPKETMSKSEAIEKLNTLLFDYSEAGIKDTASKDIQLIIEKLMEIYKTEFIKHVEEGYGSTFGFYVDKSLKPIINEKNTIKNFFNIKSDIYNLADITNLANILENYM